MLECRACHEKFPDGGPATSLFYCRKCGGLKPEAELPRGLDMVVSPIYSAPDIIVERERASTQTGTVRELCPIEINNILRRGDAATVKILALLDIRCVFHPTRLLRKVLLL